jgi:hypothetical protein
MYTVNEMIDEVMGGASALDIVEALIKGGEEKVLKAFLDGKKAKSKMALSDGKVLSSPRTGIIFARMINNKLFVNPEAPKPVVDWLKKNSETFSPDFRLAGQGARLPSGKPKF